MPGDTLTRDDLLEAIKKDPSLEKRLNEKGRALLSGSVPAVERVKKAPSVPRDTSSLGAPPKDNSLDLSNIPVAEKGGFLPNKSDIAESLPLAGGLALPALATVLAPETGGLSLAALAGMGAMGGGAWRNYMRGKPMSANQSVVDFETGASGEGMGQIGGTLLNKLLETGPMKAIGNWLRPGQSVRGQQAQADFKDLGIQPSLGQATGSTSVMKLERIPPKFAVGGGTTAKLFEQQAKEAREAVDSLLSQVAPTKVKFQGREMLPPGSQTGQLAKKNLRLEVEKLRSVLGQPFQELSDEAGELIVATPNAARAVETIRTRNPMGPPTAANKTGAVIGVGKQGAAAGNEEQAAFLRAVNKPLDQLNPTQQSTYEALGRISGKGPEPVQPLTFDQARNLESQLGALVGPKKNIIAGDRNALMLRRVYAGLRSDIDAFARSEQVKPDFAGRLARARNQYAQFNDFLDRGVKQAMKSDARLFSRNLFSKVDDPQVFAFIRDSMGPMAFGQAKAAWLADLAEKSTTTGRGFAPARFAERLGTYLRNGMVDQMFNPKQADQLRKMATVFRQLPGELPEATGFLGTYEPIRAGLAAEALAEGKTAGLRSSASFFLAPKAISEITANPRVVNALTKGISGKFDPKILRMAGQFVAQEFLDQDETTTPAPLPTPPSPKTPLNSGLLGTPPNRGPTLPPGVTSTSQAIDWLTRQQ